MKKTERPSNNSGLIPKLLVVLVILGVIVGALVYYHSIKENPYTSEVFFTQSMSPQEIYLLYIEEAFAVDAGITSVRSGSDV